MMRAPPMRAPLASAAAVSLGLVWPSLGTYTAPTRSSVRISGHNSPASRGVMTTTSRPNERAIEAARVSSVRRSAVRATAILPLRR